MEITILVFIHCISLIFAGQALLTKRDPRSALGWAVALIFLPVIALVIYLIFGISRAHSKAEKIMQKIAIIERQYPHLKEDTHPKLTDPVAIQMAGIATRLTSVPLCGGNTITPLHDGEEAYPAMITAIENAKQHVYLSTYIFSYGNVAQKFIDALVAAHTRGVDVRVLVDGIGALYSRKKPWKILQEKGVPVTRFRPPSLIPPRFGINLRSHRKVLVCDTTGFTGGMNIADGDVMSIHRKGLAHIQDVQFECVGPVVAQLRQAFLLNWSFCTNTYTPVPEIEEPENGSCICRVIVDGPGKDADALYDLICTAISVANKSVRIMTPYFLPPAELMGALRAAAIRGVDTRIVLPGKNNLPYMTWATEHMLPELLRAGVKVWHQPPPFAHTKLLAIDGFYSLIGSANMDSRSLKLNFELNMEIYDPDFHERVAKYIDGKIAQGAEVTLESLSNLSLPIRLRNAASWIFSPYF